MLAGLAVTFGETLIRAEFVSLAEADGDPLGDPLADVLGVCDGEALALPLATADILAVPPLADGDALAVPQAVAAAREPLGDGELERCGDEVTDADGDRDVSAEFELVGVCDEAGDARAAAVNDAEVDGEGVPDGLLDDESVTDDEPLGDEAAVGETL